MERARILIVDDHAEVINGLRELIETEAATEVVGAASSAEQAIESARLLKPDVVVMDFSMGEMDGIDAARAIRTENPATQVVILSVYEAQEHAFRARQAGINRWIPKSQPPDVLLRHLRELAGELRQRH